MPIYEFVCMQCESHFEELVRLDEGCSCPDCGSADTRRQMSAFAALGVETKPSLRGAGGSGGMGGCCGGACGC